MYMFVLKKQHHGLLSRDALLREARLPIELESNITHCQQMPVPDPSCIPGKKKSLSSRSRKQISALARSHMVHS